MPSLSEFLFGKKEKTKQRSFQSPQQQQLMNSLLGGIGGQGGAGNQALQFLQRFLNPNQQQGFEQFSQPYMQQFQSRILPEILQQYGAGAEGGALSSSAFAQALGGSSSDFMSQLAQLYSGQQQNAASNILGLGQNLLGQQTFGFEQRPGSTGFLGNALTGFAGSLSGGFGGGIGDFLGQKAGRNMIGY